MRGKEIFDVFPFTSVLVAAQDEHLDILQNIEIVIRTSTGRSDMSDYNVMRALDALTGAHRAGSRGDTAKQTVLEGHEEEYLDMPETVHLDDTMKFNTITSGILCVASAMPDPPFEFMDDETPTGFDVELMQAICADLGLEWRLVHYSGADFNGIFVGLTNGSWDCVASGTTITQERQAIATFCAPYVESGQSLVCTIEKTPNVNSVDDLRGMIIGVQHGNTSEPVAHRLKAEGRVAEVRTYAYRDIGMMLNDLEAGTIGAVMKLAPVMRWLVRNRPALRVVQEGITDEKLGVAVRLGNDALRQAIDDSQAQLRKSGVLVKLTKKWLQT